MTTQPASTQASSTRATGQPESAWARFGRFRTERRRRVSTPIWKRITSLLSLGSIVIIVGVAIALALGLLALMTLVLLEGAAG